VVYMGVALRFRFELQDPYETVPFDRVDYIPLLRFQIRLDSDMDGPLFSGNDASYPTHNELNGPSLPR